MKNKRLLAVILAVMVICAAFTGCQSKQEPAKKNETTTTSQSKDSKQLQPGNWAPANYERITKLIKENGVDSSNYNKDKKPYIVVDWDNTTIYNDVEEATLVYQIENLAFKMTPDQFESVIKTTIPKDNFVEECNNADGKPVNIDLIAQDLKSSYKYIYENYKGMKGSKSLDEIHNTNEYKDFSAKLRYLYAAIGETFSADISYPWVCYLFTGMNEKEVRELSAASIEHHQKQKLQDITWTSPKELSGKAGVVSVTFHDGLRIQPESQNLYKTLIANGIDVYVCSASFIDVVKEFATNPKFGYDLPMENVYAMQLERDSNGVILPKFDAKYDQTQTKGKTLTIQKFLASKYGYGPIMICGDSDGDVAMASDFPETQLVLIFNRLKGGDIGELCKKAAEQLGDPNAKYILQGRDENNGTLIKTEMTIKPAKLLK